MVKFKSSEITPEKIYKNRRNFIKNLGLATGSLYLSTTSYGLSSSTDENELRNQNHKLNRDELKYAYNKVAIKKPNFKAVNSKTEQSRAMFPAWELLDRDITRWDYVHKNPQNHVFRTFENNISSRIEVKDKYL